jgi:hypothetical protein
MYKNACSREVDEPIGAKAQEDLALKTAIDYDNWLSLDICMNLTRKFLDAILQEF